jgi:hypothetical protein
MHIMHGWSIAEKPTGRCQYIGPVAAISTLPDFAYHWPGSLLIFQTGFPNSIYIWPRLKYQRDHRISPHRAWWNQKSAGDSLLGPGWRISVSPPNFAHSWHRLEYHHGEFDRTSPSWARWNDQQSTGTCLLGRRLE